MDKTDKKEIAQEKVKETDPLVYTLMNPESRMNTDLEAIILAQRTWCRLGIAGPMHAASVPVYHMCFDGVYLEDLVFLVSSITLAFTFLPLSAEGGADGHIPFRAECPKVSTVYIMSAVDLHVCSQRL